jgi:hypothetical protein
MVWLVRSMAFAILFGMLSLGACQQGPDPEDGVDPPDMTCIDHDNDTYGANCEAGLDCDDMDPDIWTGCDPSNPCPRPRAGCPCELEGQQIECRTSSPAVSPDGSELCYAGVRTCVAGAWTTCDSLYSYPPLDDDSVSDETDGVHREPLLGHPRPCMGSCDPDCMHIFDCLGGDDMDPGTSVNLRYDLQRAIGDAGIVYPPAIIIDEGQMEGSFTRTFNAACGSEQMGVWWAVSWGHRFPEPSAGSRLFIYARTADSVAGFTDALAWRTLVECPVTARPGSCTLPVNPHDRQFADGGNLYQLLGYNDSRRQYLQLKVRLIRSSVDAPSPRFMSLDTYIFCSEAS